MNKRTVKHKKRPTKRPSAKRTGWRKRIHKALLHPKATFVLVVVCLFFVVLNWAVQQASWLPAQEGLAGSSSDTALPGMAEVAYTPAGAVKDTATAVESAATPAPEPPLKAPQPTASAPGSAWDYFHPSWEPVPAVSPLQARRIHPSDFTVSDATLERLVGDPNRRVDDEFEVTSDLRDRVLFWLRVHTQYTTQMRVIHDRRNPSIIYGVADFSPLFLQSESNAVALTKVYRHEREILRELRARLAEAAGVTRTTKLSAWERSQLRQLLSRAGALSTREASVLVASVRSQTGQRDEFIKALSRSEELLPYIEATFRSAGLPVALGRIPFVESSFNARAHSKVGATGMWQFMPFTARQMISPRPELWSDPLRQTRAAARMLQIFRSLLPDWSTTVTAYNSGVGRLQRLTRKYRASDIGGVLDGEGGLGFAGKNFYAQFLSANIAQAYRREIFPLRTREDEEVLLAFTQPQSLKQRFHNLR